MDIKKLIQVVDLHFPENQISLLFDKVVVSFATNLNIYDVYNVFSKLNLFCESIKKEQNSCTISFTSNAENALKLKNFINTFDKYKITCIPNLSYTCIIDYIKHDSPTEATREE